MEKVTLHALAKLSHPSPATAPNAPAATPGRFLLIPLDGLYVVGIYTLLSPLPVTSTEASRLHRLLQTSDYDTPRLFEQPQYTQMQVL